MVLGCLSWWHRPLGCIARGAMLTTADRTGERNRSGGEQLPVPLGDDLYSAVGHLDRGLVVDGVRRAADLDGPSLCLGQGVLRHELMIQVREDREVDEPQSPVVTGWRLPV